jgi:hypothetical protein
MNKRIIEIDTQIENLIKEKQEILLKESTDLPLLKQIENLENMGFGQTDWLENIFEEKYGPLFKKQLQEKYGNDVRTMFDDAIIQNACENRYSTITLSSIANGIAYKENLDNEIIIIRCRHNENDVYKITIKQALKDILDFGLKNKVDSIHIDW